MPCLAATHQQGVVLCGVNYQAISVKTYSIRFDIIIDILSEIRTYDLQCLNPALILCATAPDSKNGFLVLFDIL